MHDNCGNYLLKVKGTAVVFQSIISSGQQQNLLMLVLYDNELPKIMLTLQFLRINMEYTASFAIMLC